MGMSRSEAGKLGALKAREIQNKQKQVRIDQYNQNKKTCSYCTEELQYEDRDKKFCTQSCSAKYHNESRKKHTVCIHCGEIASGKHRRTKQKYCSTKCQQAFIREQNYTKLVAGESVQLGHDAIRNILIEKYGARCMGGPTEDTKDCRWDKINPTTGKCPIELEHIDGDSSNNRLENLKLLCPSCHSLTPTYKALNKGNGRHERMKRYHEGKSY